MLDTTFQNRYFCLLDLADIAKNRKDYQASNKYLRQYIDYADSLIFSEQTTPVSRLIHEYHTKMRVREEQLRGQRTLWGSIGIAAILFFLLMIVFQYQLYKKKQERQEYKRQLEQNRQKITMLQTTITNNETIVSLLKQKEQQSTSEIAKLESEIQSLRNEKVKTQNWLFMQSSIYKKVQSLRKQWIGGSKEQKVLNHAEQQKLREMLSSIYSEQVESLRSNYPRLTEDDIVLLCLQTVSFDSQSIAICFGYGDTHAINQRKLRIKERMKPLAMQM